MIQTTEDKLKVLARYLGCNEKEFVKELTNLIEGEREKAVRDFKQKLVSEWTVKLLGTYKLNLGGVIASIKAPKDGELIISANQLDYAVEDFLSKPTERETE